MVMAFEMENAVLPSGTLFSVCLIHAFMRRVFFGYRWYSLVVGHVCSWARDDEQTDWSGSGFFCAINYFHIFYLAGSAGLFIPFSF